MNTNVEKIEKNVVNITITVEAEKFAEALNKAYKKNVGSINVPGFRKGKAPLSIIKKMYGNEVFYGEAEEIVINDTLGKAIVDNEIKIVDRPEIDVVQSGEGTEFIYTAKCTTIPEVELGEYKGVEVKKIDTTVTDEEVEAELKTMQDKNSRTIDKEDGAVENNDTAVIDFEGFIDGVAFEGGKGENYSLVIGSHSFIDTFEDQLIGLKKGDSKDVVVSFPENYGREELNGKQATFKVTVNEIKVKELPALDDEFAKDASEFETLEELKADIKKKLVEYKEHTSKHEFEEGVINGAANNATVEIPQVMVDQEIAVMVKDLEARLKSQGLDLDTYYKFTNSSEEKVKEFMKENAEKRVKTELVISAIAKAENIEVTDEEALAKAKEVAASWGTENVDQNAQMIFDMQKENLKMDIITTKVIDLLTTNAKIVE
ncbi:MAG: trigger factor [Clostridiaceae bacterium]